MDVRAIGRWVVTNREVAFDLVRIYLGLGLVVRGFVFGTNPAAYYGLVDMANPAFGVMVIAHFVAIAHIAGGLLLMVGLLTRIAALVQIPILFVAVFFVHAGEGLVGPTQGLEFAALVLVLLVAYAIYGAGPLSLDHHFLAARLKGRDIDEDVLTIRRTAEIRAREEAADRPPVPIEQEDPMRPCTHGRSRRHPRVAVEREFSFGRRLRFITGTTSMPSRVVFRCLDCGGVAEISTHPEDLNYYRYHEDKPAAAGSSTV